MCCLESAILSTIHGLRRNTRFAAVDAEDKVVAMATGLGLMKGDSVRDVRKGGQQGDARRMNDDRDYTRPGRAVASDA